MTSVQPYAKSTLSGPIVFCSDLVLTNAGTPWDATNSPGALLITGLVGDQNANLHTNKVAGQQMDFFPVGVFQETHPNGAVHVVQPTNSPNNLTEQGTSLLLGAGLVALAGLWKRKRV